MSEKLPIIEILPKFKQILGEKNVVILQAPPGAGKSTLLPIELLNEKWLGNQKILMLEPRRLAARSVANRMADLLGENVGQTVGYRVRFDHKISASTRLEVLTEGILTRMLQQDNALEGVGLVIFDEFHERSVHADLALALCREIQQVLRNDLKILVMSATLDSDLLSKLLGNAPIVTSSGRQFPIDYHYLGNDTSPIFQKTAQAVKQALKKERGDILVFLPGTSEINKTFDTLSESLDGTEVVVHKLYGDLSLEEQQAAIMPNPDGKRKVVLSTSIAETSLTIEGIKVVIDSGLSRVPKFDPRSGFTRLETAKVTLDVADQRAGRAGRLGPGVCYRLWSEGTHLQLLPHRSPEILDADMTPLVLELAEWGVKDISLLTWITLPPQGAVSQAKDLLTQLGAFENDKLTKHGRELLALPVHPRIAHLLKEGVRLEMLELAIDVASILEERDFLPNEPSANLAIRVEILQKWRQKEFVNAEKNVLERIDRNSKQLATLLKKSFHFSENKTGNLFHENIGRLIAAAFPERIAKQRDNDLLRYKMSNGRVAKLINQQDELDREKWLAIAHLDASNTSEGRIFLAAPLNPDHIQHLQTKRETVRWDSQKGVFLFQNEILIGDIILKTTPLEKVEESLRQRIAYEAIRLEGIEILPFTEAIRNWQNRIIWLKNIRPNEELPEVSDSHLLATLEEWLFPLPNIKRREDFLKIELIEMMEAILSWDQKQLLDKLAPEKIKVPSGFEVPLEYFADGRHPILSVRLQEMFGLANTPCINEGRTKVILHLLSPGYKPVQVTQDLQSFWKNTYPEVRKELRVRYQKHHWPEDPWNAEAVRGGKRNLKNDA